MQTSILHNKTCGPLQSKLYSTFLSTKISHTFGVFILGECYGTESVPYSTLTKCCGPHLCPTFHFTVQEWLYCNLATAFILRHLSVKHRNIGWTQQEQEASSALMSCLFFRVRVCNVYFFYFSIYLLFLREELDSYFVDLT